MQMLFTTMPVNTFSLTVTSMIINVSVSTSRESASRFSLTTIRNHSHSLIVPCLVQTNAFTIILND